MARLNIEDKIMKKAGFQKLMIMMGDRHKAMGVVWDLWRLAQESWYPDKKLIPLQAFDESDLPECLFDKAIGLAERREGGIYAKGSEEQFAWLFQASDAGKKSAESKRLKKESERASTPLNVVEPPLKVVEPPLKVVEPPLNDLASPFKVSQPLYSLLSTLSSKKKRKKKDSELRSGDVDTQQPPLDKNNIVTDYCRIFKIVHKTSAVVLGADAGMLAGLTKTVGYEKALRLIEAYFRMPDPGLMKAAHPVKLFFARIQEIGKFSESGLFVPMATVRTVDQTLHHKIENDEGDKRFREKAKADGRFEQPNINAQLALK